MESGKSKGFTVEFDPTDEAIEVFREFHQKCIRKSKEKRYEEIE